MSLKNDQTAVPKAQQLLCMPRYDPADLIRVTEPDIRRPPEPVRRAIVGWSLL